MTATGKLKRPSRRYREATAFVSALGGSATFGVIRAAVGWSFGSKDKNHLSLRIVSVVARCLGSGCNMALMMERQSRGDKSPKGYLIISHFVPSTKSIDRRTGGLLELA